MGLKLNGPQSAAPNDALVFSLYGLHFSYLAYVAAKAWLWGFENERSCASGFLARAKAGTSWQPQKRIRAVPASRNGP